MRLVSNLGVCRHLYGCRGLHPPNSTPDQEHCSAGISIRAYTLWFLGALFFLAYAGMIRDIVFIIAQILNLAAICAIVIYARRYENKFCTMHRNLLLNS